MPDVPTVVENGIPDYVFDVWYGLLAPARTPRAIIGKLNSEINKALKNPQLVQRFAGAGLDVFHDEPLKAGDPILSFANTVLSPHNAGQTPEVRRDGLLLTIQNVKKFLAGAPQNVVV
mgnify:CR=1 FL=1